MKQVPIMTYYLMSSIPTQSTPQAHKPKSVDQLADDPECLDFPDEHNQ
jgi:hypothetical protein